MILTVALIENDEPFESNIALPLLSEKLLGWRLSSTALCSKNRLKKSASEIK